MGCTYVMYIQYILSLPLYGFVKSTFFMAVYPVLYMTMGWESNRLSRHTIPLNYKRKTAKRKIFGLPYLKKFSIIFVQINFSFNACSSFKMSI
jgi:hypothetical protein